MFFSLLCTTHTSSFSINLQMRYSQKRTREVQRKEDSARETQYIICTRWLALPERTVGWFFSRIHRRREEGQTPQYIIPAARSAAHPPSLLRYRKAGCLPAALTESRAKKKSWRGTERGCWSERLEMKPKQYKVPREKELNIKWNYTALT